VGIAGGPIGAQLRSNGRPARSTLRPVVTIELTTKGARTGRERRVTLYAAADGEALVIVGSWAGRPRHPAWVHNLRADPRVMVRRGRSTFAAVAREVDGEERERLWQLLVAGFPMYERFRARTDRLFAIFCLEPEPPVAVRA
jgi:deazaflavin-dependent oxidoreductase (nitroreductase family)